MKFLEFSSLYDIMNAFPTEQACIDYFEQMRWNGNVVSPFAEISKVYKCKNNRYKCSKTNKYFNVRTGSIFADSKLPLRKWIMAIYIFTSHKKGISSYQLARDISITQPNAWFLLHRLRYAMGQNGFWNPPLEGIVEVDETYIGGKMKNKHRGFGEQPDDFSNVVDKKMTVVGGIERNGMAKLKHIKSAKHKKLQSFVCDNVKKGTHLITDENQAYASLKDRYVHNTVKHMIKEYVRGEIHTNTVENLWSQLKWVINGSYRFTSPQHLQSYLNEFTFRYNRRKTSEYARVNSFLYRSFTGSLKYHELIKKRGPHI